MTTICCKCAKTKTADGWVKLPAPEPHRLSHGFCPTCHRQALEQIRAHQRQLQSLPANL